ncbi:hypothetical protein GOP47_0029551 [Adiantum capillus-veneris]|nr:hypothetical protein GOP47_0029551 [Adiantum capillus-veneris]
MELQQPPFNVELHSDKQCMACSCASESASGCAEWNHLPAGRRAQKHAAIDHFNSSELIDLLMGMRKRRRHVEHACQHQQFKKSEFIHVDFDKDDANQCLCMHGGGANGTALSAPALDPSVWNSLPTELLERILACLPMASLFRFRAVCRFWNAAPFRPLFRRLHARMMMPETWLIMLGRPHDAQSRSSHVSSLSVVFNLELSKTVTLLNTFLPFPPNFGCISYCATAGGLICYHYHMGFSAMVEKTSVSLWVGNPFTKEWKCLPPMIGSFPLNFPLRGLVGMVILDSVANENAHALQLPVHYKIVVRTQSRRTWGSGMMTEEYDSLTDAWRVTTTGNVPSDHRIEQVLHCSGSLYFLTWQMRDGIYVYHLAKQKWWRILPPRRYQFTSPHMVECCGRLVLVSGVGKHHTVNKRKGLRRLHVLTTGIKIWQLVEEDQCSMSLCSAPNSTVGAAADNRSVPTMSACSWSALSRMPEELVQEFVTGVHFHCTSIQNLIYLTNSVSMLIFNVVARMWRRVIITQPPFLVQDFVSFVPNLEASP